MHAALAIIAANLAWATVMAVAVALFSRLPQIRRQPRLRHALWLLVIAKLVAPPVFKLPVLPHLSLIFRSTTQGLVPPTELQQEKQDHGSADRFDSAMLPTMRPPSPDSPSKEFLKKSNSAVDIWPGRSKDVMQSTGIWWTALAFLALLPSGRIIARSLYQARRIGCLIRQAPAADERLRRLARQASKRMGLTTAPHVRIVQAQVTPLLWIVRGRPLVVLPIVLVRRLDDEQVECILCHELAHFIRRDHWAGGFALAVAAAYWWCPIAWWARSELLTAREQCCDALVIARGNVPRRRYAETLLMAVEFIHEVRPLQPVLASGFGQLSSLRRRFEMIASTKTDVRITMRSKALVLVACAGLFCLPVQGQDAESGPGTRAEANADSHSAFEARTAAGDAIAAFDHWILANALSPEAPVVEKGSLDYRTAEVTVDSKKHCMYLCQPPASGQGALRIDLDRGVTYTVCASGEAYMSDETGDQADPFPGVTFLYCTDAEDGYAIRQAVLKPGDSVTFTTPWLIAANNQVFATAFFVDAWGESDNRGSYTLTLTRLKDGIDDQQSSIVSQQDERSAAFQLRQIEAQSDAAREAARQSRSP